jgi:enamine deaminase RidA (YjgF/YER057c/UK114 family)
VTKIEARLDAMGLRLPEPPVAQAGGSLPPQWIRIRGNIAYLSGQSARNLDGTAAGPFGKVPSAVSIAEAQAGARGAGLALVSTLKRELGDLDRVSAWLNVQGLVNADAGFTNTTAVMNAFSEFIIELFGPEIGAHARSSPGVATLPGDSAVIITAMVEIDGGS